jgi:predicted dehydrogenase
MTGPAQTPAWFDPSSVRQSPELPARPRPIVSIGAGAIVREAHAPAYRMSGFTLSSVYDLDRDRAERLAREFDIPKLCGSLAEAVASAPEGAVFDLALPAAAVAEVLSALPDGATVLIQKPMGENLDDARRLLAICEDKRLLAAVNFQLRFAPCLLGARDLVERGAIGELHDVEVRVTCDMPWQLWSFLFGIPRMEIVYHSIHYVDLVRSFLGEPLGVYAKTVKHPKQMQLASTRTAIAFDYGTEGAIVARLGVNLDYPRGLPDKLEYCLLREGLAPSWQELPLIGNWFPRAFVGTMSSLMRRANHETSELPTSVTDAFKTMAVVEACYQSSDRGGTPIPR